LATAAERKPKVRAVTAFVRLDRVQYRTQVQEALAFLRTAKHTYEQAGYEVQSIRITSQPFPDYTQGLSTEQALAFFRDYEQLALKEEFLAAIGPAGIQGEVPDSIELLREIQRTTAAFDSSLVVATEEGVDWNAVRTAARLIKYWTDHSPGGLANFRFAATALVPPYTPFYPGSTHVGPGRRFALALESANVVRDAVSQLPPGEGRVSPKTPAEAAHELASALGRHASAIEKIARQMEADRGWTYEGIDLSPAPLKEVSIGRAVEAFTGEEFGSSGTLTAAALITDALRSIPVKRAGYSGLMVPVLEDEVLAARWSQGTLNLDALLAYSAVCGTGLDTVPLPGDVSVEQLERIIGDMASLAVKLRKPLSARLMPVAGKKAGERTEFNDPFLVNTTLQPLP
jgi:hypothetical protein